MLWLLNENTVYMHVIDYLAFICLPLYHCQGQREKFLSAIDLMKDITGDDDRSQPTPHHTPTHHTPIETSTDRSRHTPRSSHHHQQHERSLAEKRFRSTSTLSPNNPSTSQSPSHHHLKHAATTTSITRSPGKQRSQSVGQRPVTSSATQHHHTKKISHQHHEHHSEHLQSSAAQQRQRKHSSHSNKT